MNNFTDFGECFVNSSLYELKEYFILVGFICIITLCSCVHSIVWVLLLWRVRREERKMSPKKAISSLILGGNIRQKRYQKVSTVGRDTY